MTMFTNPASPPGLNRGQRELLEVLVAFGVIDATFAGELANSISGECNHVRARGGLRKGKYCPDCGLVEFPWSKDDE